MRWAACLDLIEAHVAQLVEHTLGKGEVSSSNLLMGSIFWGDVR